MWDKETARRYDAWFQTEVGAFALKREMRLLERMTAAWPRRGQRLVEIGCGTGVFLEVLHHSGFDVTGLDASPDMLEQARGRLGGRADLHLGDAGHLPFDDKQFDFAVLLTVLEFCPDPALVLQEAARVARKAVLVGFLNRCSLYGLSSKLWPGSTGKLLRNVCWFTPWGLTGLVRQSLGPRPLRLGSVLIGPKSTWRETSPLRQLNSLMLPVPVGAICACAVNLTREPVVTPLPAFGAKAGACAG